MQLIAIVIMMVIVQLLVINLALVIVVVVVMLNKVLKILDLSLKLGYQLETGVVGTQKV